MSSAPLPTKTDFGFITNLGNGYQLFFEEGKGNISIRITRLHDDNRHSLTGELEVAKGVGDGLLIFPVRINLLSYHARQSLIKDLEKIAPGGDWNRIIGTACSHVLKEFRQGEPAIEIWPKEEINLTPKYLIEPIVYQNHPSIIFGEKGSAKSITALALGYVVQLPFYNNNLGFVTKKEATPTLFIDYEDDYQTFEARWSALERGFKCGAMPILYQRLSSPIADNIELLQDRIAQYEIGFLIIDSLGLAAGGNLNEAEPAIRYHSALRQLGLPSLTLAHTAKDFTLKRRTIFGSVYFTNLARSVWEIKGESEIGENELIISLRQTEANYSKKHPAMGFRFLFEGNAIRLERQNLADTSLSGELPLRWQIKSILKNEKLTRDEIADRLDKSKEAVRKQLKRMQEKDIVVQMPDKTWGLKAQGGQYVQCQHRLISPHFPPI